LDNPVISWIRILQKAFMISQPVTMTYYVLAPEDCVLLGLLPASVKGSLWSGLIIVCDDECLSRRSPDCWFSALSLAV